MPELVHVWPEPPALECDAILLSAVIEAPGRKRRRLWYRVPAVHGESLARGAEPFALAMVFTAMEAGADLRIHGEVSSNLLANLEELAAIWSQWRPRRCAKVAVQADTERDQPQRAGRRGVIVAFSGGVDSSFTVWRHLTGHAGRRERDLAAALFCHGFDIPLDRLHDFQRATGRLSLMLDSLGLSLLTVASNYREFLTHYGDAFGAGLASCLILFEDRYEAGMVASDESYAAWKPSSCTPLTNACMSSDVFPILNDGAAFSRQEKVRALTAWPEAMKYLRVCWEGERGDRNCGRCEKCIRTILAFRAAGAGLPECFERDVTLADIRSLRRLGHVQVLYLQQVLADAREHDPDAAWVRTLGRTMRRALLRRARKDVRHAIRDALFGAR